MAKRIQPLQIGSIQDGTGTGKWRLCTWSDEDTSFPVTGCCKHEHDTPGEAFACRDARLFAGLDVTARSADGLEYTISVDMGQEEIPAVVTSGYLAVVGEYAPPKNDNSPVMTFGGLDDGELAEAAACMVRAATGKDYMSKVFSLKSILVDPLNNTIQEEGQPVRLREMPGYDPQAQTVPSTGRPLPDSGARTEFGTGAKRDAMMGKGLPSQIPPDAIRAMARRFEDGARKYGLSNWMSGIPLSRYYDAMMRHLMLWAENDRAEEHDGAVLWNMAAAMWTLKQIEAGKLPKELNDLPYYNHNNV